MHKRPNFLPDWISLWKSSQILIRRTEQPQGLIYLDFAWLVILFSKIQPNYFVLAWYTYRISSSVTNCRKHLWYNLGIRMACWHVCLVSFPEKNSGNVLLLLFIGCCRDKFSSSPKTGKPKGKEKFFRNDQRDYLIRINNFPENGFQMLNYTAGRCWYFWNKQRNWL